MAMTLALGSKIAGAVALAAFGTAGFALSPSPAASAHLGGVWVDAPLGGSRLPVGRVTVLAHASGSAQVDTIRLTVDGHEVATTGTLSRTGTLAYGSLTWQAAAGTHVLLASDDHGHHSSAVTVVIGAASRPPTVVGTTRPGPSGTPTTGSATATATGSSASARPTRTHTSTPSAPPASPSAPPASPTVPGPSAPVTTTAPAPPPVLAISAVTVDPSTIDNICPGPTIATVTATVTAASGVTAYYGGNTYPMSRSGSAWTVHIPSSDFIHNQSGAVSVEAVHPGEKAVDLDSSNTLTVQTCKP